MLNHQLTSQSNSQIKSAVSLHAVSRSDDVIGVDQSSSAHVDRLLRVLLQDGRLPRILSELAVAIDVRWILDSTVDSLGVSDAALLESTAALLVERRLVDALLLLLVWHAVWLLSAADGSWSALLRRLLVESLSLLKFKKVQQNLRDGTFFILPFQHSKHVLRCP